ncbi:methyl-accepting chemotaxis protein [Aurantiacibacter poecillastricola]|uniref:methyl-accepting chemotaxis protein n=1 Tax=Aurantiacibacter poecillastricola TaxID=3064385 RepID=UPI00273E3E6B|nr:methyl-accepting chemotaxis protein [Aurantiacibacter sp. 219JJ12-13]MDP5260871.1 methyl-accepting chemotaxis protein [Aurantiacibacter sp. 219JJ12-13]
MGNSDKGFAGWLGAQSIARRLGIQAAAAIVIGLLLIAAVGVGSLLKYQMTAKDDEYSQAALYSALLEKDFASLERDAFRYALVNDGETQENYEGNFSDMLTSIADTRAISQTGMYSQLDKVEQLTRAYDETVRTAVVQGRTGQAGVAGIVAAGDAVDAAIEVVRDDAIARSEAVTAEQHQLQLAVITITALIVLLSCLVSVFLANLIKRLIAGEMDGLIGAIGKIEAGELATRVPHMDREDELGKLARASERLREARLRQVESENRTDAMVGQFTDCLGRMSDGDLTVSLPELGAEYEELRQRFNDTVAQLHETMKTVSLSAGSVRHGSEEIRQASDDLAQRNERQAADLSRMTGSVGTISDGMAESATAAGEAARSVDAAMAEARNGGEIVSRAMKAMDSIETSTTQIGNIISVIEGFSFQTSLLALNAGVEAARAGEVGRGFAVVASEVRELAQRSSEAAEEIRQLIDTSAVQVASGARLVRETGSALDQIIERVSQVAGTATQISEALSVHAGNLDGAKSAMNDIDRSTQQNAAMAEQSNAAARQLAGEADNLTSLVEKFKLRGREIYAAGRPATARASSAEVTSLATAHRGYSRAAAPRQHALPATSNGNLAVAIDDSQDWSEF